jgi:hypothetical protein
MDLEMKTPHFSDCLKAIFPFKLHNFGYLNNQLCKKKQNTHVHSRIITSLEQPFHYISIIRFIAAGILSIPCRLA